MVHGQPQEPETTVVDLEMGGLGAEMARYYLMRLGGRRGAGDTMAGPGWQARVVEDAAPIPGSRLQVQRVRVRFEGAPGVVTPLAERFRFMAMRGGG